MGENEGGKKGEACGIWEGRREGNPGSSDKRELEGTGKGGSKEGSIRERAREGRESEGKGKGAS